MKIPAGYKHLKKYSVELNKLLTSITDEILTSLNLCYLFHKSKGY